MNRGRAARRAAGVATGLLIDRALGEPPTRFHPVAWFGATMQGVEGTLWADHRAAGVGYTFVGLTLGCAAGALVRSTPLAVALSVAGRGLREAAGLVADPLGDNDLDTARTNLRSLVGRDPSQLDASGIAAAVIESVAENSVDAVVAPAFWGLVAGAPGTLAYRSINTMDAMVGHRNERYKNFGWASARLDDVANYVPARCFVALVALAKPERTSAIWRLVQRDARAHPSPNAGVAETAVAAAIDKQLGGPLRYGERQELRPTLGDGLRPQAADIDTAVAVANRTEAVLVGALGAGAVASLLRSWARG